MTESRNQSEEHDITALLVRALIDSFGIEDARWMLAEMVRRMQKTHPDYCTGEEACDCLMEIADEMLAEAEDD